ncbi:phage gp6-like head-tail connector protein [Peribacillus frigoritolerans]|nr:phage gp6-like head-tail connector protein [Peribacillus frigoritolerans]MCM3169015.1 phage gp6-like head-tail connector protein [Peribacillus frigoritolerans]
MEITTSLLEEFKKRMHISHSSEDDNLKRLLSFSVEILREKCGAFDVEKNVRAKELVFERTRYLYNDAVEYFEDNFLSEITSLGLSIALKEGDSDAAV